MGCPQASSCNGRLPLCSPRLWHPWDAAPMGGPGTCPCPGGCPVPGCPSPVLSPVPGARSRRINCPSTGHAGLILQKGKAKSRGAEQCPRQREQLRALPAGPTAPRAGGRPGGARDAPALRSSSKAARSRREHPDCPGWVARAQDLRANAHHGPAPSSLWSTSEGSTHPRSPQPGAGVPGSRLGGPWVALRAGRR